MLKDLENLVRAIRHEPWAKGISIDEDFWGFLAEWVENHVLSDFLDQIVSQVDEIVDIDPKLLEPQILEMATRHMVKFLGGHSASARIYDPQTKQMLSYGSYPFEEDTREAFIPLEGSIAGEVVKTRSPCLVPDILDEKRYRNKEVIYRKGCHSLMAIPFEIPSFFPGERDAVGVIQIYYIEKGRTFTPLEILVANLMAKRLSFVIARKKILSMHMANEKKEKIVGHIFRTLRSRGGVKIKEIYNRVLPELADMVNLQSSALFSVTDDLKTLILEAGYPDKKGYHSIGKKFSVSSKPVFELLLNLRDYSGESVHEVVTPSYTLVANPQMSKLISSKTKLFAKTHNINSILYIPLSVDAEISHIMTFEAMDQIKCYKDDEINIFMFLGRELMKAQKMEQLGDALHDFKNPAIAIAGFARRLKRMLEGEKTDYSGKQIRRYADILIEETSRLQELALSIYQVGKEQVVDFTGVLKKRFEINKEAVREQLRQNIELEEGPFQPNLNVYCYSIHVERVFDNLLNNATKAVPLKGGLLAIRTYEDDGWACAEITNTGHISEEDRLRVLEGDGEGRGLYITYRIIRLLKGEIKVLIEKDSTTFLVRIPIYKGQ